MARCSCALPWPSLVSLGCVLFHANGLGAVCCDLFNSWQVKPPCPRYASADSHVEGRRWHRAEVCGVVLCTSLSIPTAGTALHPPPCRNGELLAPQLVLSPTPIPEGWIEQSFSSRTLGSDVQKGPFSSLIHRYLSRQQSNQEEFFPYLQYANRWVSSALYSLLPTYMTQMMLFPLSR